MSELTQALDQISQWTVHSTAPLARHFQQMKPGLSRAEIDQQLQDFPFALPEEFYELYEWHNGGVFNLSYLSRFYPLDEAIALYRQYCQSCQSYDPHLFPVLELAEPDVVVCVQGAEEQNLCSPVLEWRAETPEPGIWYGRLTDLLQAVSSVLARP